MFYFVFVVEPFTQRPKFGSLLQRVMTDDALQIDSNEEICVDLLDFVCSHLFPENPYLFVLSCNTCNPEQSIVLECIYSRIVHPDRPVRLRNCVCCRRSQGNVFLVYLKDRYPLLLFDFMLSVQTCCQIYVYYKNCREF